MIDDAISLESIMKAVPDKYHQYIWSILGMDCILKKGGHIQVRSATPGKFF